MKTSNWIMWKVSALVSLFALGMGASAQASTVLFNDVFNSTPYGAYNAGDSMANFVVTEGNVSVLNCSAGYDPCMNLDFSANATSRVETSSNFLIEAGASYDIAFWMPLAGGFDTFTFSVGSNFSQTFSGYTTGLGIQSFSFTATTTELAVIAFMTLVADADQFGPYISSVSLTRTIDAPQGAVPLPAAALFLGTGLLGMVGAKRSRRTV